MIFSYFKYIKLPKLLKKTNIEYYVIEIKYKEHNKNYHFPNAIEIFIEDFEKKIYNFNKKSYLIINSDLITAKRIYRILKHSKFKFVYILKWENYSNKKIV